MSVDTDLLKYIADLQLFGLVVFLVCYFRRTSGGLTVGEFVTPGAWLTAGGRAEGRAGGRPKPQSRVNFARLWLVILIRPES